MLLASQSDCTTFDGYINWWLICGSVLALLALALLAPAGSLQLVQRQLLIGQTGSWCCSCDSEGPYRLAEQQLLPFEDDVKHDW